MFRHGRVKNLRRRFLAEHVYDGHDLVVNALSGTHRKDFVAAMSVGTYELKSAFARKYS